MSKQPKVSFILLTKNGGKGVKRILSSIRNQDYPQKLVEIIVVDDGSTDNSVNIAKSYKAKVIINKGGLYRNWVVGLHNVTGEFMYYVEQDIELRGKNFIQEMIKPMLEDKRLIATFTRESYPHPKQSWPARFLSYHPSQCDPLYEFLTPALEKTFLQKKNNFILCKFSIGNIPPFARMFYRIAFLKKTQNWKAKDYFDHDFVIQNIKAGYNLFGYVPQPGIYHFHANSLKHLLAKRARNLDMHYFPYNNETEYKWVDINDKKSVIRLVLWVIYANLFIPEAIRGVFRAIKNKDLVLLMQPIISISVTDVILWKFLGSSVGRNMLSNALHTLTLYRKPKAAKRFIKAHR